jgi:hypothetical protein
MKLLLIQQKFLALWFNIFPTSIKFLPVIWSS